MFWLDRFGRKGWIHPILPNRPRQNTVALKRGKELNKFCPPFRRDDLCLCFWLHPASMALLGETLGCRLLMWEIGLAWIVVASRFFCDWFTNPVEDWNLPFRIISIVKNMKKIDSVTENCEYLCNFSKVWQQQNIHYFSILRFIIPLNLCLIVRPSWSLSKVLENKFTPGTLMTYI